MLSMCHSLFLGMVPVPVLLLVAGAGAGAPRSGADVPLGSAERGGGGERGLARCGN